ncbi:hypothetical protein D3C81_885630 [compost metagenome]
MRHFALLPKYEARIAAAFCSPSPGLPAKTMGMLSWSVSRASKYGSGKYARSLSVTSACSSTRITLLRLTFSHSELCAGSSQMSV